jgi:hypothetical protein
VRWRALAALALLAAACPASLSGCHGGRVDQAPLDAPTSRRAPSPTLPSPRPQ